MTGRVGGVFVAASTALAVLSPGSIAGQELEGVTPGSRIRVSSPVIVRRTAEGVVTSNAEGWLGLATGSGELAIPVRSVTRVQASRGKRPRTIRGAAIGLLAGAVIVLVRGTDEIGDEGDPECAGASCPALLAGGLAVGAFVGYQWRTEEWEELPVSGVSVELGVGPSDSAHLKLGFGWRW